MISVANIFRYTIEDCNRIMFILKEYVEKQLQKLGYSEDKRYFNYYLFLEIFENRTEETLLELYNILKECNKKNYSSYYPNDTEISCFYYSYINREISNSPFWGGVKKVDDKEKVQKYCMKVIQYLLQYKQLFRLMYKKNYPISLKNRLNRIKGCLFDTTIVGFDEIGFSGAEIKYILKKDIYDLSDFMYRFYNIIYKEEYDIFYKNTFKKICHLDLLHPLFNREKSLKGEIQLIYPYNLFRALDYKYVDIIKIYSEIKDNKYEERLMFVLNYLFDNILRERESLILKKKYIDDISLSKTAKSFFVSTDRISQLHIKGLNKLKCYIGYSEVFKIKFYENPISFIDEILRSVDYE